MGSSGLFALSVKLDTVLNMSSVYIFFIYIYFAFFCAQRGCNIFYNVIHPCDGKAESEIIIIYRFKKQLFCVVNGCAA